MISLNGIFDAYLNANILLAVGFGLWFATRALMGLLGLGGQYRTQLGLLNGLFIAILISPVFVFFAASQGMSVSFSDVVVSRYLEGGFAMKPSELEQVLSFREVATSAFLSLNSPLSVGLAGLMLIGAGVGVVRLAWRVALLRGLIKRAYRWRQFGRVRILLSDELTVPFSTRGWRNRYVVMPSSMLAQGGDLRIALSHELVHLRGTDLEWEVVLEACRPLFFWNPAFHLWKRAVEELRELACDQRVLARYDARRYGACLLRVCEAGRDPARAIVMPSVALVGRSERLLKRRVVSILEVRNDRQSPWLFAVLLVPLMAAILASGVSLQKSGDWSHDRLMLSTIVNLERMRQ